VASNSLNQHVYGPRLASSRDDIESSCYTELSHKMRRFSQGFGESRCRRCSSFCSQPRVVCVALCVSDCLAASVAAVVAADERCSRI